LVVSCKKDTQAHAGQHESLIGTWKWVRQTDAIAINGIPYDTLTPQNTGITQFLDLNADSTWALSQNNKVVNSGDFKISQALTPFGPIYFLDFIGRNGSDSLVNHSISNDTLYISNTRYIDKYTMNVYAR
jgi:hypothetical protein